MARRTRTRSRWETFTGSRVTYLDAEGTQVSATANDKVERYSTITDSVGRPITDSALSSTQSIGCARVSGSFVSSTNRLVRFNGYPVSLGTGGVTDVTPLAPREGWYLNLIARTNPSRPVVTPLTLIQDLIELPGMLFSAAKFLSHASNRRKSPDFWGQIIGWQFGWAPLLRDIGTIVGIAADVAKRAREVNQLYNSPSGLRRRVTLESDTLCEPCYTNISSLGHVIRVNGSHLVRKQSWATIRWHPTAPPPYQPGTAEEASFIRKVVLGLTPEGLAAGAWEVLPWSWLINWFYNIGDYTLVHSNTIPADHSLGCFMSESRQTRVPGGCTFTNGPPLSSSLNTSGVTATTMQTRIVSAYVPSAGFNIPFMGTSRWEVSVSLMAARMSKLKPYI